MLKFGLQNLRRLRHVEPIELKPITLLVGRNSSGKSSFLRTLPLFRQSLTTRISSPILWYGDFVDYGSFESSSGTKSKITPITFSFVIDRLQVDNNPSPYVAKSRSFKDEYVDVAVDISIVPFKERTRISRIQVHVGSFFDCRYIINIDEDDRVISLVVNGVETISEINPYRILIRSNSLLPEIIVLDDELNSQAIQDFASFSSPLNTIKFYKSLDKILRPQMDGRIKRNKIDDLLVDMIAAGFPNEQYLKSFGKAGPKVLTSFLNDLTGRDTRGIYGVTERILAVSALVPLLRTFFARLKTTLASTLYIGPARARSERYYRYQDLAVSEIDPNGKNLPIFLNSLTARQLSRLSTWIESLFGYGISVQRERDHISINLIEQTFQPNIVDVGYGVSQILPVLGQIWWAKYRPRGREARSNLTMLAIEQPELHLHPAHQALLADAFVGILQNDDEHGQEKSNVHYIVETHSETLINRLGELVADGAISNENVQIILFERSAEDDRYTTTRTVSFDTDGSLIDWPYGFFQPAL